MAIAVSRAQLVATGVTELYNAVTDATVYLRVSQAAYVGPFAMTAQTGLPVTPEDGITQFTVASGESLFGIAATRPGGPNTATAYVFIKTP